MNQLRYRWHKLGLPIACLFLFAILFLVTNGSSTTLPPWLEVSYHLQSPDESTPSQLHEDHNWWLSTSQTLSFGWYKAPVWIRVRFTNCPSDSMKHYLEIDYPPLSSLQYWQGTYTIHTGQDQPFSSRAIPASSYIFPMRCDTLSPVFLKVQSTSSLQVPLRVLDESELDGFRETRTGLYSLYIGSMLSLILYNSFLLVSTRSLSYLFYVLYLSSIIIFILTQFGLGFQFIWPESPFINDYLLAASLGGTLLFGLLFCAGFLRITRVIPEFKWIYWFLLAAVGICCLGVLFSPSRRLLTLLAPFVTLFVVVAAIVALKRGLEEAQLFLGGWIFFLAGGTLYALQKLGVIPIHHLTEHGIVYGSLGEALFLSFSLAHRFNLISKSLALTENTLLRYLPEDLVQEIIQGQRKLDDKAQERDATVLFADLCGFTQATEQIGSEKISHVLNEFFEAMTQVVFRHHGMIDKFIGDGMMVVFGVPKESPPATQAKDAMACALAMHTALERLNQEWERRFGLRFAMRIGMHRGPVLFGAFGGRQRSEFTVIGGPVNLAARVESQALPGTVYITEALLPHLDTYDFEWAGEYSIKGLTNRIPLYRFDTGKSHQIKAS